MKTISPKALGKSVGIYLGATMLLMSLAALGGYYLEAWEIMMKFHFFASLTLFGVIMGIIEASLCGYICGYSIAWLYNFSLKSEKK